MGYRIFYAVQEVRVNDLPIHGVQSVSSTTNFQLDKVFEFGNINIYETIENIPNVELNVTKVIDGYPCIYMAASNAAVAPTLVGRTTTSANVKLLVFDDANQSTSGVASLNAMECQSMFISSLQYNFPVNENGTEAVTFVGNDKLWAIDSRVTNTNLNARKAALSLSGAIGGADSPSGYGHVFRRQHFLFGNSATMSSILPKDIPGITSDGYNLATGPNGSYAAHISNVSVKTDLSREELYEEGRRTPYYRPVNFPVEVTTEIETIAVSGDNISATESGIIGTTESNLQDCTIKILVSQGLGLWLGTKNKLQSVSYGGGDTGGGYSKATYNYMTYNTLTVVQSGDPNPSGSAWWTGRATYFV
jgi:hypothetical protein